MSVQERRTSMRLIDAYSAKEAIEYTLVGDESSMAERVIDSQPTVDAVPVVRCEKCIHYEMGVCLKIYDDGAASSYAWQGRKPDDFCSYGERKEGADNDT